MAATSAARQRRIETRQLMFMGHWVAAHLDYYFAHWGYWTVLVGIMLESAGIPLPGETILIVASTLAASKHQLNIFYVGVIAVVAATTGDNIGFAVGMYGGRPLLDRYGHLFRIHAEVIDKGERLIERRGALAVFFARFIAGLRFLAGPLAGILRMRWAKFFLFNALGAIAWVTVITSLAYFFGPALESALSHAGWAVLAALVLGGAAYWWWHRRRRRNEDEPDRSQERKAA